MTGIKMRIYVASLADYNAGYLHGAWIDAAQDAEDIDRAIAKILRTSKYPNVQRCELTCDFCDHSWDSLAVLPFVCPECTSTDIVPRNPYDSAEEWAIHDHEGFGSVEISEHCSTEYVSQVATLIEEHGESMMCYLANSGRDDIGDEILESYQEAYVGTFRTETAFAEHCVDEGFFGEIPDAIAPYIDYSAMARTLLSGDYYSLEGSEGVHVFRSI
jgi:antirestriction protein